MRNLAAWSTIALWAIGTAAQLVTCWFLFNRGLLRPWKLAVAGLAINATKSVALMVIWYGFGFKAYSIAWMATRWVHWVAILFLLLQALWALSRVWPEGRPFAVMVGSGLALFAAAAATLQSGWIDWPGKVGAVAVACRGFSIAALLFVFWCGWVYRCLRVVTSNAKLWRQGIQVALCTEVVCLAVHAVFNNGPFHITAQFVNQTAYIAACWWWWRIGPAGEEFVLPEASDLPDRAWRIIEGFLDGEKRKVAA